MAKKDDRVRKIEALKAKLRCIVGWRGKGEFSIAFDDLELQIVYDPKLCKFIVVVSHESEWKVCDLID